MARVRLNTEAISDWASFHEECARALGFPDFYGRNMNAWIDCLSYLRDGPRENLSGVRLGPGEVLELELPGAEALRARAPEVVEALYDCAAFVNRRYVDGGDPPAIALLPT
jgi:hypothetical protein